MQHFEMFCFHIWNTDSVEDYVEKITLIVDLGNAQKVTIEGKDICDFFQFYRLNLEGTHGATYWYYFMFKLMACLTFVVRIHIIMPQK